MEFVSNNEFSSFILNNENIEKNKNNENVEQKEKNNYEKVEKNSEKIDNNNEFENILEVPNEYKNQNNKKIKNQNIFDGLNFDKNHENKNEINSIKEDEKNFKKFKNSKKSINCPHYMKGICKYSNDCYYSHNFDISKNSFSNFDLICYYNMKYSNCKFENCRFFHINIQINDKMIYKNNFQNFQNENKNNFDLIKTDEIEKKIINKIEIKNKIDGKKFLMENNEIFKNEIKEKEKEQKESINLEIYSENIEQYEKNLCEFIFLDYCINIKCFRIHLINLDIDKEFKNIKYNSDYFKNKKKNNLIFSLIWENEEKNLKSILEKWKIENFKKLDNLDNIQKIGFIYSSKGKFNGFDENFNLYIDIYHFKYPNFEYINTAQEENLTFDVPYISSFLSQRMLKPILNLIVNYKLYDTIDLFIVQNCHGILHPRSFGLASQLATYLKKPVIGYSENPLTIQKLNYDDNFIINLKKNENFIKFNFEKIFDLGFIYNYLGIDIFFSNDGYFINNDVTFKIMDCFIQNNLLKFNKLKNNLKFKNYSILNKG
jgi:hypothetical protein